jgi:hypothetical protein
VASRLRDATRCSASTRPVDVLTPPPGTVTPSASGTAVVIPLDILQSIAAGQFGASEAEAVLAELARVWGSPPEPAPAEHGRLIAEDARRFAERRGGA